jgi:hypothetical protein
VFDFEDQEPLAVVLDDHAGMSMPFAGTGDWGISLDSAAIK